MSIRTQLLLWTGSVLLPCAIQAAHPPDLPRTPDEALNSFQLSSNLEVFLAAAEPLVTDPVAIDFDADGRLWVAEMRDYPMGLVGNYEAGGRVKVPR